MLSKLRVNLASSLAPNILKAVFSRSPLKEGTSSIRMPVTVARVVRRKKKHLLPLLAFLAQLGIQKKQAAKKN